MSKDFRDAEVLLDVQNLKQYFGSMRASVKAVDDVSFQIHKGEVLGVVGESGCGKTTTGRSIIKLYDITGGKVFFNNECITVGIPELKKQLREAKKAGDSAEIERLKAEIKEGKKIALHNKSKDFFFLERSDINVIYKHMILLIKEKLPPYVKAGSGDIQVLTPMRKGSLGAETLNVILQEYLNPPDESKAEYICAGGIFREGDKVMQIKNNYQMEWEIVSKYGIPVDKGMGVFNGDMGMIKEINDFSQTLTVEYDEHRRVSYAFAQVEEIELAYAVTIHKSQGSEYPAVILPLLAGPKMLFNRNLLYTGVTRAKSCVTILGSRQTVENMIANGYQNKR